MTKKTAPKKKRSRAQVVWKRWVDWRKLSIAIVTGLFLAALLTVQFLPDKVVLRPGDAAGTDIFAPRSVRYYAPNQTDALRQLVANQVPDVYSAIANARASSVESEELFFELALQLRTAGAAVPAARRAEELARQAPGLDPAVINAALRLPVDQLAQARQAARELLNAAMARSVRPDELGQTRPQVIRAARDKELPPAARDLAAAVATLNLAPNQVFNREETQAARRREMDRIPPQYETIKRGDLVLRKGERVTPDHLTKLGELGLIQQRIDVVTALSLILLAFGLVAVFCLYLYQFHPAVLRSFSSLLLLAVVVCGCMLLFRVGSTALGLRFSGEQLGFLGMICSALGAMLIAALLCPQIAVFVGVALGLLTSVLVGAELRFAILSIVSSLVGVQSVTNIRNRAGILRAALILSLVNGATAVVSQGATQSSLPEEITQSVVWAGIGGITSVGLWMFFVAVLERPFRLTTHLTLLELSDPSQPLLRRLAMEAPGTYAHSINVGNLSEAAAEAIGADGLFCRVASYYHDIGKVIRPHFFIENQLAENRHNDINPSLSSLVVTSHVKDGVELAEEHRLPPPIIAIIREHHGTCLIKYFYHRAVTSGAEDSTPSLEYQFRYDGPRPQTKESGIIMLADSAEAASRTLEKPTPGRVRDMIERIVRDRLSDGQLDECELTFKDLDKIVSSMTRTLTSVLHARVEYPEGDTGRLRKMAADGAAHKESVRKALADTPETASASFGRPPGL